MYAFRRLRHRRRHYTPFAEAATISRPKNFITADRGGVDGTEPSRFRGILHAVGTTHTCSFLHHEHRICTRDDENP